ncbi:MAG: class I SAM-dependent rRNA methyltransferase [Planctomycetales bacterium]|nr:class I SAM-dependent rRNA methyltransferase [Planctomycetales bacterium]
MSTLPQLVLNTRKARSFSGHHPWVVSHSIIEPTIPLAPGQAVELVTPNGHWIGRGFYNPASAIRVRLYQWSENQSLNVDWCLQQLERAVALRRMWADIDCPLTAVRLINSEGDGLSGLIVDRFGDYIVIQVTALAIVPWLDAICDWLSKELRSKAIFVRTDARIARNEGMPDRDELVSGSAPDGPIELIENDVRLMIDLNQGQKTGYYLDQRANRLRAAKWIGPGRMLDVCCYLGGFSLAACRWGQPSQVTAVDSSQAALQQAAVNSGLNGIERIEFIQADCFDFLEQQSREVSEKFQTVVLDPPRLAGNRNQVPAALRAYHRLNLSAVKCLRPGGVLVTCSCSGRISRADFTGMLASVAKRSRRTIQILWTAGADFDHPVDASCPETEYLKCYFCRVE